MAKIDADRNLLFGFLALQMDFVSREALLAALGAWVADKSRDLGQVFLRQGALSGDRHALLDALVREHLKAHGDDPAQSLAALSSVGPVRRDVERIADADLHASLATVPVAHPPDEDPYATRAPSVAAPTAGEDPYATRAPSVGTPSSAGTRFRILRPHARGGLGEVYVAHDEELHREVALKEIQDRWADHPDSRSKFLLEAEVTGGLEHPNIVPVYGLGQYADGRPFYAMRFIRGDSLADAIARFHRAEGSHPDPGQRALELRQLLGRFVDVCDAIAYAHSRGILHRDLKPGNVMLGKYGETLVVDWGLAKPLDRPQEGRDAEERPLVPPSSSRTAETLAGTTVGTPAYMSPEQAAGRLDRLGPASDVYSLGATLYSLLTGRPPVEERDVGSVLQRVQRGDIPPPRQVNASVPPALEAICRKAMALRPEERYASPRALADDVEHWLADEPVAAYREPWAERLGRWGRRHKPLMTGAAALLLAAVVVLAISTALINGARRREKELRNQAESARQDAAQKARAEASARQREAEQRQHAELARNQAEQARRDEAGARQQTEAQLYLSNVALAGREWLASNPARVEDLLNECPPDRRRWEWHYLKRQLDASRLTLVGPHVGSVTAAAFSPDGTRLVSAGWHGTVVVWDANKGQVIHNFEGPSGHRGHVLGAAFGPDGRGIATAGVDRTVRLWDAATGVPGRVLQGHAEAVTAVAFSPDGTRLASAGRDRIIKLWDPTTGEDKLTVRGHEAAVTALALSPDGTRLASAGEYSDTAIRLWDAATGKEIRKFPGHILNVNAVAFRPDGRQLASASNDGTVILWDVETGQAVGLLPAANRHMVHAVAYSPDGKLLAAGGNDQSVQVWDAATGAEAFTLRGHTAGVACLAFRPDGRFLASGGENGVIKIWDATRGPESIRASVPDAQCSGLAFSPDGRWVASATRGIDSSARPGPVAPERAVRLWEAATGAPGPVLPGPDQDVVDLAFGPDGTQLAAADARGDVTVWEIPSGRTSRTLPGPSEASAAGPNEECRVAFGPDGRILACAVAGTVRGWEIATGRETWTFCTSRPPDSGPPGRADEPLAVGSEGRTLTAAEVFARSRGQVLAFSPDRRHLAVGETPSGEIHIWDVAHGNEITALHGGLAVIGAVTFSPDGSRVASLARKEPSAFAAGEFKIWDVATGREVVTFPGPIGGTRTLAFSPDGRRLASTGLYQGVTIWDASNGRELLTLRPTSGIRGLIGAGTASRLAFSPDGTRLALADSGGVTLWDASPGPEVLTLHVPAEVTGLAYHPEGGRLAVNGDNGVVQIRQATTGRVLLTLRDPDYSPDSPSIVVFGLGFSPDGARLAGGGGDGTSGKVILWDATTGAVEGTLRGHTAPVVNVAFSPDGRRLASAGHDKTAKVWDTTTLREIWTLRAHTDRVNGAAFSPDGTRLVTAGRDGAVKLWDTATGQEVLTLSGHHGSVISVAFSPDGRRLASAGGRGVGSDLGPPLGELNVWDVATGQAVLSLPRSTDAVLSVAFSPDGRSLATSGDDRVVRVRDVATGREILALRGHHDFVLRVAFSPDGRSLASAGNDRTIRVWDLSPPPGDATR